MELAYIYLLQHRDDIGTITYKFGKFCQQVSDGCNMKRLRQYPKGSLIHYLWNVPRDFVDKIENEILQVFQQKYNRARGMEWIEGDVRSMKKDINTIIDEYEDSDHCAYFNRFTLKEYLHRTSRRPLVRQPNLNVKTGTTLGPIQINDFRKETGSLLSKENIIMSKFYLDQGIMTLIQLIHFNDEYSENKNLRKGSKRDRIIVRENGHWVEKLTCEFFEDDLLPYYINVLITVLSDEWVYGILGEREVNVRCSYLTRFNKEKHTNEWYGLLKAFQAQLDNSL